MRIPVALATVLVSMVMVFPAFGQSAKDVAPVEINLEARVKEVQANPRQIEAFYKIGAKVAAVCANCHGDNGNSNRPDIPNLAEQNPAYLLEQMRQFISGERRNEFMQGLIKALKPDDKIGMVIFYSRQEIQHKPATNAALAAKGQSYYVKNCLSCHGEQGHGNEKMAHVAGQQSNYLSVALKRYRDGSVIRSDPLMAAATKPMTDADIAAVVTYISAMK
jgi:cytochrome c553